MCLATGSHVGPEVVNTHATLLTFVTQGQSARIRRWLGVLNQAPDFCWVRAMMVTLEEWKKANIVCAFWKLVAKLHACCCSYLDSVVVEVIALVCIGNLWATLNIKHWKILAWFSSHQFFVLGWKTQINTISSISFWSSSRSVSQTSKDSISEDPIIARNKNPWIPAKIKTSPMFFYKRSPGHKY